MQSVLRVIAHIVSVLFHPLLILTYITWLFLMINPPLFGKESPLLLVVTFITTFVLPAVGLLTMKGIGLVSSLQLEDRTERTGPYILSMVFYIWYFVNSYRLGEVPMAYNVFILGATLSLFAAFLINIFFKISAHTTGMGGLVGMVVITMYKFSYETFEVTAFGAEMNMTMTTLLMIVLVIAGLVGTARMLLSAHRPIELYSGYILGFGIQFVALLLIF